MASSIYVYSDLDEYERFYGRSNLNEIVYKLPIIDMYIDPILKKLFVVTNTDVNMKNRIQLERTIVHIRNNERVGDVISEKQLLVEHGKLKFNKKKYCIEFFPRLFRNPLLSQHVDRAIGNVLKKSCKFDYNHRYYDFMRDRINLILDQE